MPSSVSTASTSLSASTQAAGATMAAHVREGLSRLPKTLSSMYFYDDEGSRLFQQIMQLPEYYPTRTEMAIFTEQGAAIGQALASQPGQPFRLVELGAGDGSKTKVLLQELLAQGADFTYAPVDISGGALAGLAQSLSQELPQLRVEPIEADYFSALAGLHTHEPKVVLFLGSNIGNFLPADRQEFLQQLASHLTPADRLLIGFDLQKDPRIIRAAYDDSQGVTAAFNLNLLHRFNRELGADFDLTAWEHYTDYDPLSGAVRSFLVSRRAQTVQFPEADFACRFAAWEVIHTENSYKFSRPQIETMARAAGLRVQHFFTDERQYFADVVLAPAAE
ncbi:L-histidine N(alpha)-methyltransferase [Hymenobacter lutimineralis]|nr:L-histidine N(alpha)-methyltransferase [Hymenobacter lutimineralis]